MALLILRWQRRRTTLLYHLSQMTFLALLWRRRGTTIFWQRQGTTLLWQQRETTLPWQRRGTALPYRTFPSFTHLPGLNVLRRMVRAGSHLEKRTHGERIVHSEGQQNGGRCRRTSLQDAPGTNILAQVTAATDTDNECHSAEESTSAHVRSPEEAAEGR